MNASRMSQAQNGKHIPLEDYTIFKPAVLGMDLLKVNKLFISFGGIQALAGIDFHIEENELLTVIGPNGSGKTTLF